MVPYFLFIFVSAVWGSNFILMKRAGLAFGPVGIGAWRVFGGALVLALVWWFRSRRNGSRVWKLRRKDWRPLWTVALVSYAWPFAMLPWLIQRHGSAFAGMMVSLVPLLTILVSIPLLRIFPTVRQLGGVLAGLLFFAILVREGLHQNVTIRELAVGVSIPLCYAVGNTYLKRRLSAVPSLPLSCISLTLASVVLLPLALVLPSEQIGMGDDFGVALAALVMSSFLATGIATYVFYKLIQDRGPLFAGMTAYLIPLGALIWGWIDRENVTSTQIVALFAILVTVAVVQFERRLVSG